MQTLEKDVIEEGNKLIAEFMGYIWEEKYNGYYKPNPKWTVNGKVKSWIEKIDGESSLKYHSSWDWLYPVIKKISDYVLFTDFGDEPTLTEVIEKWKPVANALENVKDTPEIFLHAVEFIKFYNKNNK